MMKKLLKKIATPYVDAQTLIILFQNLKKPREAILRLVKNGELIRLKNGFFLISERIYQDSNPIIPFEQTANLLYGPSYVSLEWALSFYGMIPEKVHTITSMTIGRDKEFMTPVGNFVYHRLSSECYAIGITQKNCADFIGSFLMASKEKALADLVFITGRNLTKAELRQDLFESKRIDREHFKHLDKNLLEEIAKAYRKKSVRYLSDLAGSL